MVCPRATYTVSHFLNRLYVCNAVGKFFFEAGVNIFQDFWSWELGMDGNHIRGWSLLSVKGTSGC